MNAITRAADLNNTLAIIEFAKFVYRGDIYKYRGRKCILIGKSRTTVCVELEDGRIEFVPKDAIRKVNR